MSWAGDGFQEALIFETSVEVLDVVLFQLSDNQFQLDQNLFEVKFVVVAAAAEGDEGVVDLKVKHRYAS